MLQTERKVPAEVFTVTDFFNNFRCLIPECILNGRLDWFDFGSDDEEEQLKESMHF
jgi:hypothetical protein